MALWPIHSHIWVRCKLIINLLFGVVDTIWEERVTMLLLFACHHLMLIAVYYIILVFKKLCFIWLFFSFVRLIRSFVVSLIAVVLSYLFSFRRFAVKRISFIHRPRLIALRLYFICLFVCTQHWFDARNTRYLTLMQWINVIYFTWNFNTNWPNHRLTTIRRDKEIRRLKHESLSIICNVVC